MDGVLGVSLLLSFIWMLLVEWIDTCCGAPQYTIPIIRDSVVKLLISIDHLDYEALFLTVTSRMGLLLRQFVPQTALSIKFVEKIRWFLTPVSLFSALAMTLIALLGPFCHLISFTRLVRVRYTHNLPLTMDSEEFNLVAQNDPNRFQWRFHLEWRDPTTHPRMPRGFGAKFVYYLSTWKTIDERMDLARAMIQDDNFRLYGAHVLRRVENDPNWKSFHERDGDPAPSTDAASGSTQPQHQSSWPGRSTWKSRAMERIALQHKLDLEQKVCEDPLGMAVYKTFGIGLGFRFDHMSELDPSKPVPIRRLHARAAKSSIRRAQKLEIDVKTAKAAVEAARQNGLVSSQEIELLKRRADVLAAEAKLEIQSMAQKLIDLVPTNASLPGRLEQFTVPHSAKSDSALPGASITFNRNGRSPVVQRLLDEVQQGQRKSPKNKTNKDSANYLNPTGEQDINSDENLT
ncbi:hypothetical protein ACA910_002803 [Epithemia clementina (nom. ined.)]